MNEAFYYRRMQRLRISFHQTLGRSARLRIDRRIKRQCQHLLKQEAMCWTFLKDHRIPRDNCIAECVLRPYVIWIKLSVASQSYQRGQFCPLTLSIVGTAQRLGISGYLFLRTACHESMILSEMKIRFPFDAPRLPAG
jgi:transposase